MLLLGQVCKSVVNYRRNNLGYRRGYFTISLLSALSLMTNSLNPKTTLDCHRRKFTFNATAFKIDVKTGEEVLCHGMVSAPSCWGRCDSSEVCYPPSSNLWTISTNRLTFNFIKMHSRFLGRSYNLFRDTQKIIIRGLLELPKCINASTRNGWQLTTDSKVLSL